MRTRKEWSDPKVHDIRAKISPGLATAFPSFHKTETWRMYEPLFVTSQGFVSDLPAKIKPMLSWDDFGPDFRPVSNRQFWNPFVHYNCDVQLGPELLAVYGHAYNANYYPEGWFGNIPHRCIPVPTVFGLVGRPFNGLPSLCHNNDPSTNQIDSITGIDTLHNRALRQMLPGIRPKLYTLVELFQLKDFASFGQTIKRVQSTLPLLKKMKHAFGADSEKLLLRGKIGTLIQLLAVPADVYLQWKFNIDPTMRDIAAVHAALSSVREKVKDFLGQNRKLQVRHCSFQLDGIYRPLDEVRSTPGNMVVVYTDIEYSHNQFSLNVPYNQCKRITRYPKAVYHAEIEYYYDYPEVTDKLSRLESLLDILGIGRNPIKELWELIPWSFVVDWVIDIGQWLDNFDSPRVKPHTVITKWCWSQSIQRTVRIETDYTASTPPGWFGGLHITNLNIVESSYKRGVDGLGIASALTGSGIDSQEFILGTALALTRHR